MDFNLAANERKTLSFKFDKVQNLAIKINVDLSTLANYSGTVLADILRCIITCYSVNEKNQDGVLDLSTVFADGALTLTPLTQGIKESMCSVHISGWTQSAIANRVDVTFLNATGTANVRGTCDVSPGIPQPDATTVIFTLAEDTGVVGEYGAGVDIPPNVRAFRVYINKTSLAAGSPSDCTVQQIGPNNSNLGQSISNTGKTIDIHPNCIALKIQPLDTSENALNPGYVVFELFK